MRAAQINDHGSIDALKTVDDVPKPHAGTGQVLVEVHAAAVNPFDIKVIEGQKRSFVELKFPATLGGDVSGVVAEIGEGAQSFRVGDQVYGQANALSGQGSFAEFTPVKAESLAQKPGSLSFEDAAGLPLTGCSAYQAIVDTMNLQTGQTVLIHGGSGGIGSLAIQIAKHIGAHIITTTVVEDTKFVKGLGADQVIDYKSQDFSTLLKDIDAVYDTVGGETYTKSFNVLKAGGIIVSMVEEPNQDLMKQHGVQALHQFTKVTTERLNALTKLVEAGVLKIQIDKVFPLDEASQALAYLQSGKHRGKVIIKVKN